MPEPQAAYFSALLALGLYGALYLVQLLVADAVGIRLGHTPGTLVDGGHDDFHFRATRAHANTSESVGAVLLVSIFAMGVGADPAWVGGGLWTFLGLRALHMLAYYMDLRVLRSVAFALALVALLVVLGAGLRSVVG